MNSQQVPQGGQQLTIPTEVRNFLESLLQDAGMKSIDDDMHEEMVKELYVRLDSYLTSTIVKSLPAENMEEFMKMNEEKRSQAEIEQFLKDKVPNAQDIFAQAFMEFRDLYLGNVTVSRNTPSQSQENIQTATPQESVVGSTDQSQTN